MNSQFLICFFLLFLFMLLLDTKHMPRLRKRIRMLYIVVHTLTFGLYVSVLFGITPAMPTQYFIRVVSPWVYGLINR